MNKRQIAILVLLMAVLLIGLTLWGYSQRGHTSLSPSAATASTPATTVQCPNVLKSWNIANMGRSKSPAEIALMAKVLRDADIVLIQEVTARRGFGAQAIAQLRDELSRMGADWDYIISDPTASGKGVERYAYLWKKHTVAVSRGDARLVDSLRESIDREPYMLVFTIRKSDPTSVFNFHAIPRESGPQKEVAALVGATEIRNATHAIVAGDFNLASKVTDPYFAEIGYRGHINRATSLRNNLRGDTYLLRQYDNIYTKGVHVCASGVVDFVAEYFSPITNESLKLARAISDHLPVYITFK